MYVVDDDDGDDDDDEDNPVADSFGGVGEIDVGI